MKRLFGIGVGPGDPDLLTLKAVKALEASQRVYCPMSKNKSLAQSIAAPYLEGKEVIPVRFPMGDDNAELYRQTAHRIAEELEEGQTASFLTLGDPMIYSTYSYLMKEAQSLGLEVITIPGITSFQAAAAELNLPLTLKDEAFYLADGSLDEDLVKKAQAVALLKIKRHAAQSVELLQKQGFNLVMARRVGQEEAYFTKDTQEMLLESDYMSLILATRGER